MRKFDRDEQIIYEELSKITVDSSKLTEKVKSVLKDETLNIKSLHGIGWSRTAVIAIILSTMLVLTVAGATLGGLDWFKQNINPLFGDFVQPVGQYVENQGIRMEVIGAEKYDDMAIIYMSLQDISGYKRLTDQTTLLDSAYIGMRPRLLSFSNQSNHGGGFSWRENFLDFDKETNTIYYEFVVKVDSDTILRSPLELETRYIYFDTKEYENEPISISLEEVELADTIPIEEHQILASSKLLKTEDEIFADIDSDYDFGTITEVLLPGYYSAMPHGRDDQWISNVGIVDNKLRVQVVNNFGNESAIKVTSITLTSPDGEIISSDYNFNVSIDENDIVNKAKAHFDESYKYEEIIFEVDTKKLSQYTLNFSGMEYTGLEGVWKIAADLDKKTENMITIKEDFLIDGYNFEHITLNPLGINARGSFDKDGEEKWENLNLISVAIELSDKTIQLEDFTGTQDNLNHKFEAYWESKTPLDVDKVTAIIINDTRIPIRKDDL